MIRGMRGIDLLMVGAGAVVVSTLASNAADSLADEAQARADRATTPSERDQALASKHRFAMVSLLGTGIGFAGGVAIFASAFSLGKKANRSAA